MGWTKTKSNKLPNIHQRESLFVVVYKIGNKKVATEVARYHPNPQIGFTRYGTSEVIKNVVAWYEIKLPSIAFSEIEIESFKEVS